MRLTMSRPITLFQVHPPSRKKKTFPQDIQLHPDKRIVVILVPMQEKSITLKTVGLLQLMLQKGYPVHERSRATLLIGY